jgi:hypothetical protein
MYALDDVCYNIHADTVNPPPTTLLEPRPNDPSWYKGCSKSDWVFTMLTLTGCSKSDWVYEEDDV